MSFAQDGQPNTGLELTLVRVFDAPQGLLFRMWTDPDHLRVWSCPRGFTISEAEGGVAAAGEGFRLVMRSPDGVAHVLRGVYLEVTPVKRVSFTHQWEEAGGTSPETTVSVHLEPTPDGRTKLTLHQGYFDHAAARDGHEGGWSESLDKLSECIVEQGAARADIRRQEL